MSLFKKEHEVTFSYRLLIITSVLCLCFAVIGVQTRRIYGKTEINISEINFIWKLDNFSFLPQNDDQTFSSDEFYEDSDERWVIELGTTDYNKYISVSLKCVASYRKEIRLKFSIDLLDTEGTKISSFFKSDLIETSINSPIREAYLIKREDLLRKIFDDKLVITCILKVTKGVTNLKLPTMLSTSSEVNASLLLPSSWPLTGLLTNGDFSDVTFLVDGTTFRAHKSILSAQSKAFYDMFKQSKSNQSIEIKSMKPKVFENLLQFIYTKNANLKDYSAELMIAADTYGLKDLKEKCEMALFKKLAAKILKMEGYYTTEDVREEIERFLIEQTTNNPQNAIDH